jgi:two-component system, OmpR family, sensor kinase
VNRLFARLTMAFILVTLVTVAVVAIFAGATASREFQRYVDRRDQLEENLAAGTPMPDAVPDTGQNHPPMRPGGSPPGRGGPPPEDEFIYNLRIVLVIAVLIAGSVGTVLGLVISRTIAAPLANLSLAARDFADRRWDRRVPVTGTDEIADVAHAFNAMADALQRGEILRRNLMADIAHELRTPLTVMQGNLRALLDGVYPLEMHEVATLYDETRLLSRLVADLRELALAESGQLPLNMQAVDVQPVLQQVIDQFAMVAEAQETRVELNEKPLPSVQADPDRLAQVLHNFLANGLRHTTAGLITVSGESLSGQVRIRVSDSGEGIAPTDLPYIFDRFYRANDSRPGSNTGLGLAIAKAWVEAMGGTIGVESDSGKGSSFWFTLKATPSLKTV